tara:strand:+ start:97 stop:507 length:411 start_codon:yes stop_codon:yes gene_type:complete
MTVFNEVDNMINSMFNRDWSLEPIQSTKWNPAVDVKETDNSFLISADIPGLPKKDINIEVSDDVLSITGQRTEDKVEDSDLYHYRERSKGAFTRSFHLPESVDEKKISANFKDGILSIELPKTKVIEPKSRKIKIS